MGITGGPEHFPLKDPVTSLPMIVHVYDLLNGKLERTEEIDFSNYKERSWLGKITAWAVLNKKSVETFAKADKSLADALEAE